MTAALDIPAAWIEYRRTRAVRLRNALVEHHLPLVRKIARAMAKRLPAEVDADDLISIGSIGLIRAVELYDAGRTTAFKTYACHRIRGAILDELRDIDATSRGVRTAARRVERATDQLRVETGRPPTPAEVAAKLGVTEAELRRMTRCQPLRTEPLFISGAEEPQIADERAADPLERLALASDAAAVLRRCGLDDGLLMRLKYMEGESRKAVAAALGMSVEGMAKRHREALARVRASFSGRPAA